MTDKGGVTSRAPLESARQASRKRTAGSPLVPPCGSRSEKPEFPGGSYVRPKGLTRQEGGFRKWDKTGKTVPSVPSARSLPSLPSLRFLDRHRGMWYSGAECERCGRVWCEGPARKSRQGGASKTSRFLPAPFAPEALPGACGDRALRAKGRGRNDSGGEAMMRDDYGFHRHDVAILPSNQRRRKAFVAATHAGSRVPEAGASGLGARGAGLDRGGGRRQARKASGQWARGLATGIVVAARAAAPAASACARVAAVSRTNREAAARPFPSSQIQRSKTQGGIFSWATMHIRKFWFRRSG